MKNAQSRKYRVRECLALQVSSKHRIFGLDILRILCALFIYLRHSITMFGCTYGNFADQFILSLTSSIMTCFFMISGFSMFYVYSKKGDFSCAGLKIFYMKRIIAIVPAYYFVHVIWLFFNIDKFKDWIVLTPIEMLGIQSFFNTLFGILHNGGTWFVSCILVCYFAYPIIQMVISDLDFKMKIITLYMLYFILVYSDYVVMRFSMEGNYSNPLFRVLEFACGVLVAAICMEKDFNRKNVREGGY